MSAALQQISYALGVAVAGAILEIESAVNGGPLALEDFHVAFMIIAVGNLLAAIPFVTMAKNAGASVSGHGLAMHHAETKARR
ncbi:hypothetical protein GGE07_005418 [Sinorhizobium terangae]|nr:hypothetical protein [Sinorhizobium terangae]